MPELTIWPFTETATNGTTRNPWDLQRTPGGSSGGSGARGRRGAGARRAGSDGGGSIRIPAACCGLVGLKPQHDRIPYAPKAEGWHGLSALGFLARTVPDIALMFEATTGLPWTEAARRDPGLRIALTFKVPQGIVATVDPQVRSGVEELVALLRSLGHEVVERDPDYGWATLAWGARFLRGHPRRRGGDAAPRAARAAHEGSPPLAASSAAAGSSARERRRPPTPRGSTRSSTTST